MRNHEHVLHTDIQNLYQEKLQYLMQANNMPEWVRPVPLYTAYEKGKVDMSRTYAVPLEIQRRGVFNQMPPEAKKWRSIQEYTYNIPSHRGVILMMLFPLRENPAQYKALVQHVDRDHIRMSPQQLKEEIATKEYTLPDMKPEVEKKYVGSKMFAYMALTGKKGPHIPLTWDNPISLLDLFDVTIPRK
jgi:hypothetical protein